MSVHLLRPRASPLVHQGGPRMHDGDRLVWVIVQDLTQELHAHHVSPHHQDVLCGSQLLREGEELFCPLCMRGRFGLEVWISGNQCYKIA